MPKLKILVLLFLHFKVSPFLLQGRLTSWRLRVWLVIVYKSIFVPIEEMFFQTMMRRLGRLLRRGTEIIISLIFIFIVCFPLQLDEKFHKSSLYCRRLKFIAIAWWAWLAVLPSWGRKCFERLRFWWITRREGHLAWLFILSSGIFRLVRTACLSVWRHSWTLSCSKSQSSKTVRITMRIDGFKEVG